MIQKWIKDQLINVIPELEWTFDYKTGRDDTGVVYNDSPGDPTQDDLALMNPSYTVEMESSNLDELETWAWKVYDTMNKRRGDQIENSGQTFHLIFIHAIPPIPVGIENRKMTYTVNLQVTIKKESVIAQ